MLAEKAERWNQVHESTAGVREVQREQLPSDQTQPGHQMDEAMKAYDKFLAAKQIQLAESGIGVKPDALNPKLFDFQRDVVSWALRKGRVALFLD